MRVKKTRWILLAMVVLSYVFMYTQSKRDYLCDTDCLRMQKFDSTIRVSRDYVYWTSRCSRSRSIDTLCIEVKDTIGINWNLFADTACMIATQNSLLHQKIFLVKRNLTTFAIDTVIIKQCP